MPIANRPASRRLVVASCLFLAACKATPPSDTSPSDTSPSSPSSTRASTHGTVPAMLGRPVALSTMESLLDQPGSLSVETVLAARWESPRSGLLNLENAKASALQDGPEPVEIYFHAVRHPDEGLFLLDTGIERGLAAPDGALRTGPVGQAFNFKALKVELDLASWLAGKSVAGVFLTHLHLDHLLGLPDLPREVPIFTGAREAASEHPYHPLTQPVVDGFFAGRGPLRELSFEGGPVLDVFEDGSLFAIAVPGHTPGNMAFVARTARGSVLFTGDACHTAWGWTHDVEPGTFSHDVEQGATSLAFLRGLAARHPTLQVRLGHQSL